MFSLNRQSPVSQAALAKQNPGDPRTALRFELYIDGTELCNGYEELTDAEVLARRRAEHNTRRAERCEPALPGNRFWPPGTSHIDRT